MGASDKKPLREMQRASVQRNLNRLYVYLQHAHSSEVLSKLLHLHTRQVHTYLASIGETEWGHVRIVGWHVRAQGFPTAYYAFGFGPDLPRPVKTKRVTQAMADKARYDRMKADPDRYQAYKERLRAKTFKPRRDRSVARLFGMVTSSTQACSSDAEVYPDQHSHRSDVPQHAPML